MTHKDPQQTFEAAIAAGFLNRNPGADRYAGKWMYMFSDEQGDHFKNINFRNYIVRGV